MEKSGFVLSFHEVCMLRDGGSILRAFLIDLFYLGVSLEVEEEGAESF